MGDNGQSSGKSGKSLAHGGKVLNLKRESSENSKTVQQWLNTANTLMYHTKTNLVEFYKGEGLIGTAKNVDKMNIRVVAKNLKKQYIEV